MTFLYETFALKEKNDYICNTK
jgi:hypothetical protein